MPKSNEPQGLRVTYALAVHGDEEEKAVVKVLREHRTNMGKETSGFEERTAEAFGAKYGVMVNSGSAANLVAVELMDLPEGSEVITPILTFATTVAPLVQKGLVPVFADVVKGKYVIDVDQIESLITKKTRALMIPLLFGNVPEMDRLAKIAKKHNLFFIADSCDTFGASYKGKLISKYADATSTSFFGAHIITTGGNGGMVMVNTKEWYDKARMLRGWGRSSSVFSESESVDKRFGYKLEGIEYDAKFIFDIIGYNLLPNEMCAAFGNVQLDRLPKFKKTREKNFAHLIKFFKKYEEYFILPIQDKEVETQWMNFPLVIREDAPFQRIPLVKFLEQNNIQTRPLFTGNILKQPGFKKIKHKIRKGGYPVADEAMERGLLVGCHHGMENEHLEKLTSTFTSFLEQFNK
jgi:CDP-6-deoxy-D-xylo-4-hexulose-3-dehydrase